MNEVVESSKYCLSQLKYFLAQLSPNEYVIKLIENLPEELKNSKTPLRLDIVLDGGIFNGSYLVGALYFLKEMEKRNYVIIERISGCSIGSVVAFLYFMDALDEMPKLYDIVKNEFKNENNIKGIKVIDSVYAKLSYVLSDKAYTAFFEEKQININNRKKIKELEEQLKQAQFELDHQPPADGGKFMKEVKEKYDLTSRIYKASGDN